MAWWWWLACAEGPSWLGGATPVVRAVVPPVVGEPFREAVVVRTPEAPPDLGELPSLADVYDGGPLHFGGRIAALADRDHPWHAAAMAEAERDERWLAVLGPAFDEPDACREAAERLGHHPTLWRWLWRCPAAVRRELYDGHPEREGLLSVPTLPADAVEQLVDHGLHPAVLADELGADAIPALSACVERADPERAVACVRALATLDREAATRSARRHAHAWEGTDHPTDELERWTTDQALGDHLDQLGFFGPPARGGVLEQLDARGWVWEPDGDVEEASAQRLLHQLGLHHLPIDGYAGAGVGVLWVWTGRERVRLLTDRDRYGADPEQVVGLANLLAREAGLPLRALLVDDPGFSWRAVTGTPEGLTALVEQGLVEPVAPLIREPLRPPKLVDTGGAVP